MLKNILAFSLILNIFLPSCSEEITTETPNKISKNKLDSSKVKKQKEPDSMVTIPCEWDEYLQEHQLINIKEVDSSLLVELKYSTKDNFMEKDMYGCLENCYLQKDVAEKLKRAQTFLKEISPKLSLLIYDGVRPRSIQQYMWDILDMPIHEKVKFVSNPKKGSLHNFGAAVDITLYDLISLKPLDMGTPYDYIGVEAWPTKERLMLKNGILSEVQIDNRKLLRKVMIKAGFFNIQTEWWHFNSCYRKKAYEIYSIIEGFQSEEFE